MSEPAWALLIAAIVVALFVLLFRPVRGFVWRTVRALHADARVRIEDALKHLYDCEYRKLPCTLYSLSGALGISGNQAVELLRRLEMLKLVVGGKAGYILTSEGRAEALRVLRVHRLWERYLAERTGLSADEWHREAEYREHRTSPEQADALSAQMGHPRFDPHGDPIPVPGGDVAVARGMSLSALSPGKLAAVVHIEDEPSAVYAQLVAQGIHPGMRVRVLDTGPERIRLEADGEEVLLAPVVAANVSVIPLVREEEEETGGPYETLAAILPGEGGRVVGISRACRGPERRRLLDLGVVPGTMIKAELSSPGGDPVAYRIRGALIGLRKEQADMIRISRDESEKPS